MRDISKIIILFFVFILISVPISKGQASSSITLYIDGQRQFSSILFDTDGEILLPYKQLLIQYTQEAAYLEDGIWRTSWREIEDLYEEYELLLETFTVNNREVIRLPEVEKLGYSYTYYDDERQIHLTSQGLLEMAGMEVGMSLAQTNEILPGIHWNTAFAKRADLIGFYGDMHPYQYVDRYGIERKGEVPDIQIEITDGVISYFIVSTDYLSTSKGIRVGDSLTDVTRRYGSTFIREKIDGKEVLIYEVEHGSIWFIANADREIERIGFWDHWLKGF